MKSSLKYPVKRFEPILHGVTVSKGTNMHALYLSIMKQKNYKLSNEMEKVLPQIIAVIEEKIGKIDIDKITHLNLKMFGISSDVNDKENISKILTLLPDNYDNSDEYDNMHSMGIKDTDTKVQNYVARRWLTLMTYLQILATKKLKAQPAKAITLRILDGLSSSIKLPGFIGVYAKYDTLPSIVNDHNERRLLLKFLKIVNNKLEKQVISGQLTNLRSAIQIQSDEIVQPMIHEIYRHKHVIELQPSYSESSISIPTAMLPDKKQITEVDSYVLPFLAGCYRNISMKIIVTSHQVYYQNLILPSKIGDYYLYKKINGQSPLISTNKGIGKNYHFQYIQSVKGIEKELRKTISAIYQHNTISKPVELLLAQSDEFRSSELKHGDSKLTNLENATEESL